MKNRIVVLEKPLFITILVALVITGGLTITSFRRTTGTNPTSFLCTFINSQSQNRIDIPTPTQLGAILYYATTRNAVEESLPEIKVVFDALQTLAPCNILVFGIGHDSLMWASLNPRGRTLFLEDNINLVHQVLKDAPSLRVHSIAYDTRLSEADALMASYRKTPQCLPPQLYLKGNRRCKLALSEMPEEVYSREWDAIIIDGPRGFYADAPGRMSVIFTVAAMARARQGGGDTHVFLHDANRKVEKTFAEEFLCQKNLVRAEEKLWHFQIPPAAKGSLTFC